MMHLVSSGIVIGALFAAFIFVVHPGTAGTLVGEVNVSGGKKLKNIVVYLSPVDELALAVVKHHRVTQKGRRFNPNISVIVAGGSATFVNDEDQEIDHNVYSLSKPHKFDIGLASKGSKHNVKFSKPGVIKYYCSVHKNMIGTIVVVPSQYFAILDQPGRFKLGDVPPGTWQLSAALTHRRYRANPVTISVKSKPLSNIELKIGRKKRKR
jgi:plastocyanin